MRAQPSLLAVVAIGTALIGFSIAPLARADLPLPGLASQPDGNPSGIRTWNPRQTPVVEVVRRVKDSVVNIHSERTVRGPGSDELYPLTPSQNRVNGMGTGIVIDGRGYIITNQHVVEDVSSLKIRLSDGTNLSARVLARDVESDLALLKITPPRVLPSMPLGTARDLQVGETVVAVGNAYGYDHTVTVGIVSALGRDVSLNKDVRYRSLIQTDAAINPGNSGGPLVNLQGDLIGVNVAIRAGAQGIGFAIPADSMIQVASRMFAQIRSRNGVAPLGIVLQDEVGTAGKLRRVLVDEVDSGAGAKAGLQKGDEILRFNDVAVASSLDVERGLLEQEAGSKLAVVVRRNGSEKSLSMTLEAGRPTAAPMLASAGQTPAQQIWRQLGLQVQPMANPAEVTRTYPQLHGGLVVGEVRAGSGAAQAGLMNGDILVGLHQWEMTTMDNLLFVLNHADRASFSPVQFYIIRAGKVHRGRLQVED